MRAKFFEKEQKTERYFQQVLMPNLVWNQLFRGFFMKMKLLKIARKNKRIEMTDWE